MRHIKFILLIFFLFNKLIYPQSGWFPLNSGTTLNLYDVRFINEFTGYFCARHIINSTGLLRKTIDGGTSWTTILSLSAQLRSLSFIDANTGTVVGGSNTIYRTTNGGNSWSQQTVPMGAGSSYNSVYFLNASVGMIVGELNFNADGAILYTSNGGVNWLNRGYGHDAIYYGVRVFDANTAIVVGVGGPSGTIIKTTNTGINWTIQRTLGGYGGVSFIDNNNGLISGFGEIGKTTNGGSNWIFQQLGSSFSLWGIPYIDSLNAYTVGDGGRIFRTTNSGTNWLQQISGTTKNLHGVSFINPSTGWACGDTGVLIKTTTGGFTAIQPISNEIPNEFKLYQNYPNPFNPNSKIRFSLPSPSARLRNGQEGGAQAVSLVIFDILGREAVTLLNEQLKPGTYEVEFEGSNYPSGVYYCRLITDDYTETRKMVLLR